MKRKKRRSTVAKRIGSSRNKEATLVTRHSEGRNWYDWSNSSKVTPGRMWMGLGRTISSSRREYQKGGE
jgi:hypothetical protein